MSLRCLPLVFAVCALAACSGSSPEIDAGTDSDATADAGVNPDTGVTPDGGMNAEAGVLPDAGPVPTVDTALDCGRLGAGGLASGRAASRLQRHDIDLGAFPDALCNDGTGAVFYFRPYEGVGNQDRWVIQLQGGGSCNSPQSCANRWCSVDTGFGMNTMTTVGTPTQAIDGKGILARRPDNPYGDWNQVFVKYCSSDSWRGTQRDREVEAAHPRNGAATKIRFHFLGRRILEAMLASLRREAGPLMHAESNQTLNSIHDASEIALVGASAGGAGTVYSLDWLADEVSPVPVRGLIDSAFPPALERLDHSTSTYCSSDGLCDYEGLMTAIDGAVRDFQGARSDTSCEAMHPSETWRCSDAGHILHNHLTTPFFVRMGLRDQLLAERYVDSGYSVPGQGPMTEVLFAQTIRAQLLALVTLTSSTAEEAALMTTTPGGFGVACIDHETLRNNAQTYDARLSEGGVLYSMPEVLQTWLAGDPALAATDAPAMDVCP